MEVLLEGAKNAAIGLPPLLRYKYKVEEVVPHPNYNVTSRENDLALIRLSAEIPFNASSEIKPICLPFEDGYGVWDALPKDGETAYLGGWGYGLKNMAAQIEEMDQAAVTIWPKDNCTHSYRGDRAKKITPKHICAYGKAERDACRGDNGGPLMALMTRQRIFFQIGIVSYGPRCGYGVPGVYTRVSEYLSWILDTMDP
ncbi:Transmembrane protease serine 11D [Orchesella cincta]|uniref:Transmembrane protease serine 11D n=1 Tax=Orchesella cincta TaxID=48709 RepID=A0A1D2MIV2_ORCCI|nr:Transmembrane protease serine 11D [Orchesella cincta]